MQAVWMVHSTEGGKEVTESPGSADVWLTLWPPLLRTGVWGTAPVISAP